MFRRVIFLSRLGERNTAGIDLVKDVDGLADAGIYRDSLLGKFSVEDVLDGFHIIVDEIVALTRNYFTSVFQRPNHILCPNLALENVCKILPARIILHLELLVIFQLSRLDIPIKAARLLQDFRRGDRKSDVEGTRVSVRL